MKEDKYVIECRYEYVALGGKEWTKWFIEDSTPRTQEETEEKIKLNKANCAEIDKKTKLKHEYRARLHSDYTAELEATNKRNEELAAKNKEYYKSAEYKELQKKKRQAAKELKERQKKYAEEHGLSK